ncbi:hypothetical protein PCASD_16036, partial [Puccinia coronata f. sp. avenae]
SRSRGSRYGYPYKGYRGSRKPLESRGLREPTGVQSLHACPKGVQALHAFQTGVQALHACLARLLAMCTPIAFGGACARPLGVPLSSPEFRAWVYAHQKISPGGIKRNGHVTHKYDNSKEKKRKQTMTGELQELEKSHKEFL